MNGLRTLEWRGVMGMTEKQKRKLDRLLRRDYEYHEQFKKFTNRETGKKIMDKVREKISPTGGTKPFNTESK